MIEIGDDRVRATGHAALSAPLRIAATVTTRDLTHVRRREAALRAAEQRIALIVEGVTDAFCVFDDRLRCSHLNARALLLVADLTGRTLTREHLIGRAVADVLPGFSGSDVEGQVLTAAHERQTVVLELPVGDRWLHVHVSPSPQGTTTVAIREITDRKLAEAGRRRRTQQQTALADLAQQAATGDDLPGLLEEAVGTIAAALGTDLAFVAEHEPADGLVRVRCAVGGAPDLVDRPLAAATPGSLLARAIAGRDPVVCEDAAEVEADVVPGKGMAGAMIMGVPGADGPFGVLAVLTRTRRTYAPDEIGFLRAAAHVLATAAERARGEQALAEVRRAERRRIARALHDDVLQELAHAVPPATPEAVASQAESAGLATLRRVGEHVHAAIHDLRLDEGGSRPIRELLTALVEDHRRLAPQWTLDLRTRALPAGPLGPRGTDLLRMIGEALTNVRRHAGATTVTVRAWASSGCVWAEVRDDGHGFDPRAPTTGPGRTGLVGIRERAALVGGRVTVTSEPGEGTVVRIGVPLLDQADVGGRLRLLLVGAHAAVREAMAAVLEAEPDVADVRHAASLREARTMTDGVDVAVVDLLLPDGSGPDLIADLRRGSPDAQALIVAANGDRSAAAHAVQAGAAGMLSSESRLRDVMAAIRQVARGEPLLPLAEVVDLLRLAGRRRERELDERRALDTLTAREREVLQLLADGLDNHAAATRLHVSPRTHRNHVANILAKLGVHSQVHALLFALRYGVVEIRHPEETA